MQRGFTFSYTLGGNPSADYANADLIIIWGKQPVYSGSSKGSVAKLVAAKERGCKFITVKPSIEGDTDITGATWVPIRTRCTIPSSQP